MYTDINFPTKKAMKDALAAGRKFGVYQPNGDITGVTAPNDGIVTVEGPHYPKPHKWYARVELRAGDVVRVVQ